MVGEVSKKILFIANSTFPVGTANSVNVFRMTTAFVKEGFKVIFVARRNSLLPWSDIWKETCRRYGDHPEANVFFLWWPFKRGAEIALAAASLLVLLFTERETLVFTRVRYAAVLASLLNYRTVFESHLPPQKAFQKRLESWMLKRPKTQMAVISRELQDIYDKNGFDVAKIKVAADAGRDISHRPPRREDFRGKSLHLGYIGSLYQGRGFEIIVGIAKRMPERYFHVVGNLTTLDGPQDPLPKNIYLYDEVTPHQAELMTRLFDVLLMPYQQEVKIRNGMDTSRWMSPLKMFEYLLSGRPVISSDLPALREILRHRENCLLVPARDVEAWVEAIEKLDDPGLRHELANQAFIDARSHYTWEKRVENVLLTQSAPLR